MSIPMVAASSMTNDSNQQSTANSTSQQTPSSEQYASADYSPQDTPEADRIDAHSDDAHSDAAEDWDDKALVTPFHVICAQPLLSAFTPTD